MTERLKRYLHSLYERVVCRVTPCCRDMTRLISECRERRPGFVLWLRMRLHFTVCIWCQRYQDHLAKLAEWLKELPAANDRGQQLLGTSARERIKKAVRSVIEKPRCEDGDEVD